MSGPLSLIGMLSGILGLGAGFALAETRIPLSAASPAPFPKAISAKELAETAEPERLSALGARLPGEFEHQRALLLSCRDLVETNPEVFADIVRHTADRTALLALVCGPHEYRMATALLREEGLPSAHLRFVELPHDTMWTRDYGPMILENRHGSPLVIDARYDRTRSDDDEVPMALARLFRLQRIEVPWVIEGGNLLSNGDGLGVMSNQVHDDTVMSAADQANMIRSVQGLYGLNQLVLLEALAGEPTGHVDMFATFTAANTILVGSYAPAYDAENAAILDRNAALLSGIETSHGPLRVLRIPMPPHHRDVWRTYTNVVYANGTVLVPVYPELDPLGRKRALETYASALPGWHVVSIDASQLIESSGALHCVTMNLGPLDPDIAFPETPRATRRVHLAAHRPGSGGTPIRPQGKAALWPFARRPFAR